MEVPVEQAHAANNSCELVTGVFVDGVGVVKTVNFRELAGHEEDILAAEKMKYSDKITKILQNCTLSFGNVSERKKINDLIPKLISADRWFYLVQIRRLSVGDDYRFMTKCPECAHEDKVVYNLEQLKVKCEAKADALMQETTLPKTGRKIRWRPADGLVEAKIESISRDGDAVTAALYSRIETIDDKPSSIDAVKNMTFKERSFLESEIKRVEGSIDDKVDFECPKCGHQYQGELPLEARSFFYPQES